MDWPKPLPDGPDGVSHDGWTWGSMGSVYAESPDRIWVAMRGELPLPEGAEPWTPYSLLDPPHRSTGNDDGLNARCEPTNRTPAAPSSRAIRVPLGSALVPFQS